MPELVQFSLPEAPHFFPTVLLLACWESLIVHKSFSRPPKLMIFSLSSNFCLNMGSSRANFSSEFAKAHVCVR